MRIDVSLFQLKRVISFWMEKLMEEDRNPREYHERYLMFRAWLNQHFSTSHVRYSRVECSRVDRWWLIPGSICLSWIMNFRWWIDTAETLMTYSKIPIITIKSVKWSALSSTGYPWDVLDGAEWSWRRTMGNKWLRYHQLCSLDNITTRSELRVVPTHSVPQLFFNFPFYVSLPENGRLVKIRHVQSTFHQRQIHASGVDRRKNRECFQQLLFLRSRRAS